VGLFIHLYHVLRKAKPGSFLTMFQFIIEQGRISILYGQRVGVGYFLTVVDTRLQVDLYVTNPGFNTVCEAVAPFGNGAYVILYTWESSTHGTKVDLETMARFWRLYGAEARHVERLEEGEDLEGSLENHDSTHT